MLAAWGVEQYGEWLALTAVATFAGLAGLGVGHAGYSDIILRFAKGDEKGAGRSFMTAMVLVSAIVFVGLSAVMLLVFGFHAVSIFSLTSISAAEGSRVLVLTGLTVLVSFYVEPIAGAMAAAVGASTANGIAACAKVLELAGLFIALNLSASPATVATIIFAGVVFHVLTDIVVAGYRVPWLSFRLADFDPAVLRETWRPALGFFGLFVCINLIGVQVPRIVVFQAFGAAALSMFTVFVTYTRMARLFSSTVSLAAQAEMGRSYANGGVDEARRLIEHVLGSTVYLTLGLLIFELIAAPVIIPVWTHGEVPIAWDVLVALAIVALVGAYSDTLLISLSALNRVGLISAWYAVGLGLGIVLGIALAPIGGLLAVIAATLFLPELVSGLSATRVLTGIVGITKIRPPSLGFWMPFGTQQDL